MFINLFDYIMLMVVMVMSRNIVSYTVCMFYVLCKIIITSQLNKLMYFSYSDIIISVYGITFINNSIINNKII